MEKGPEYSYELKIPKERIAVLIGPSGSTKRRLEKITGTKITVDTEGKVIIEGEDSFKCFKTKDIIKAIGRGFSPERAEELAKDNYCFELIEIKGNQKDKERLRGRVIGKRGKGERFSDERL